MSWIKIQDVTVRVAEFAWKLGYSVCKLIK